MNSCVKGETDHRCCRAEGAMVSEKDERERNTKEKCERGAQRRMHKVNVFPKQFTWKMRVAKFLELLQPVELKA